MLTRFWQEHVEQGVPGSLYISGAPGTGKSALVDELLAAHDGCATTVRVAKLNCMAVGVSPKNIFSKLLAEVRASSSSSKKSSSATSAASVTTTKDADAIPQLEALMFGGKQSSTKHMHLIVLDEIDQLITKDQDVLYRIFEWPKMKGARCVVIGIANALDLTQRFLPRLQTKNCI